jgi:hypothetical protein
MGGTILQRHGIRGIALAVVLSACSVGATVPASDAPIAGLRGVLVQRTSDFTTTFSNDAIPDFEVQVYDTDGAWNPAEPDRITIPGGWDVAIFHVRSAWAGHTDEYVELKLYCGAARPIGNGQEDRLVAVVQVATNPASPFVELTTPPLPVEPGTECMIAFKTPNPRTLIGYENAATLFGAYVP